MRTEIIRPVSTQSKLNPFRMCERLGGYVNSARARTDKPLICHD